MKIRYKRLEVDFALMTEDIEIVVGLRNFLLYTWNMYMEREGPTQNVREVESILQMLLTARREHNQKNHNKVDWQGLDSDEIEIDPNIEMLKTQVPFKNGPIYQFISLLKNLKTDSLEGGDIEMVGLYNTLLSELEPYYNGHLKLLKETPV